MKDTSLLMTGVLMALAGCGGTQVPPQPVSWYLEHPTEMQSKVTWCVDDAERARTPDCANATEAKRRSLIGSQSTLAPIDWGAKPKP